MIRKYCRYIFRDISERNSIPQFGEIVDNHVYPIASIEEAFASKSVSRTGLPIADVDLVVPVNPTKVVCVGRNYVDHANELGNKVPSEPLLFIKPLSSVIGSGDSIMIPPQSEQVEHEGEVAIVIGRTASKLGDSDDVMTYVLGFTCANDVTARDLQRRDIQFTRAKSFDTFCPIGPWIVSGIDPVRLAVETRVNGIVKQSGSVSQMVFSFEYLVRFISNIMTLMPGDVILTGTPAGVSRLNHGDLVEIEIPGVGILQNPVDGPHLSSQ